MAKKTSSQTQLNDCPMTMDGWVSYLQTNLEASTTYRLSIVAIIFAVIAILISISVTFMTDLTIYYTIAASIIFTAICWYYAIIATRKMDVAEKLMIDIITGRLTNSNEIRNKWLALSKKK